MAKPDREAQVRSVIAMIAEGKSEREACDYVGIPRATFRCSATKAEMGVHYAKARADQADALFDDLLTIADAATSDNVQVARLRVDARKWVVSKIAPEKYGERLDLNHSGSIGLGDMLQQLRETYGDGSDA